MDELEELKEMIKEMYGEFKLYREEIKMLKEENKEIKQENEEIKKELKDLNYKMEAMDKKSRENNIVITGVDVGTEDGKGIKEMMAKFIKEHLDLNVEIKKGHKIGTKRCLLELSKYEDKSNILKKKWKLKKNETKTVFINEDKTKKEREVERNIRKRASEEREQGRYVKISHGKLIVDGIWWKWDNETNTIKKLGKTEQRRYSKN